LQVWYLICSYVGGGGVVFAGLVSLTSSPYPSPYSPLILRNFLFSGGGLSASGVLLCLHVRRLLARKLSKPEDGRYRPKQVVFPLLINTII